MWFLDYLAGSLRSAGNRFYDAYRAVENIPILSNPLGGFLHSVSGLFYSAASYVSQLSTWAGDVARQLRDVISFDAIRDRLYLYFPWLRDFTGNVREAVRGFLDTYLPWWRDPVGMLWQPFLDRLYLYFPWLRDLFSEIRKNIERFLDTHMPWWRDIFSEIRKNIERFLDIYLPWWRDPEFNFWEYTRSRLEDWFFDFLDRQADKIVDRMGRVLERLW